MIVSIVVPSILRSNARTFDCLLSGRRLGVVTSALAFVSAAGDVSAVVFSRVAEPISLALAVRGNTSFACLFALFRFALAFDWAFVIGISTFRGIHCAAPPRPRSGQPPAGRDPDELKAYCYGRSSAPFGQQSQSFLSNLIASLQLAFNHQSDKVVFGVDRSNSACCG